MKENKNKYIRARVTAKIKKEFDEHCKKYNLNPSQRLRVIIKEEIKG